MTKRVYVTRAQSRAAKALVQRSAKTGRFVSNGVKKIAEASSANGNSSRSQQAGRTSRSQ